MFGDVPQEELLRARPGEDGRRERKEPRIADVLHPSSPSKRGPDGGTTLPQALVRL